MRNCDISRKLGVAPANVRRAIKRFQELGHTDDRPRRGGMRTINTNRKRQLIKKLAQRNSPVPMRKIARETGISRKSVSRIDKQSFNFKQYKLHKVQLLTTDNKHVRLERYRRLLRRVAPPNWKRILFTDEKLFTI